MYIVNIECPDGPIVGPGELLAILSDAIHDRFEDRKEAVGRIKIVWSDQIYGA